MRPETSHVHQSEFSADGFDSLSLPVHHASTIVFDDMAAFEARHERLYDGYSYGLYGTPTSRGLEAQIATLEGAERVLVTPSGLSAITLICLACARQGERILIPQSMYGPARLMTEKLLAPLGIETIAYDPKIGRRIAALIDDRTRLIWVESPGSATFEVQDVPAIVAAAHRANVLVAADNTWATPLFFDALGHGVDLSMQSLSKYASGHSDLTMGSVAVRDLALFRRLKDVSRMLGLGVSAEDCFLCSRGLKTMPLRLRHSQDAALEIIGWLERRAGVQSILHPSRPGHPGHELWARDFKGASGVFSVVLQPTDPAALDRAFRALRVFKLGASWGGAHSLMVPANPGAGRTDLDWLPKGPVVRLSIGLESIADLIEDLARFFNEAIQTNTTNAEEAR